MSAFDLERTVQGEAFACWNKIKLRGKRATVIGDVRLIEAAIRRVAKAAVKAATPKERG